MQPSDAGRARSVALRRNSKSTRMGVERAVLLLRATGDHATVVRLDEMEIPVVQLTAQHGLAACLVASDSVMTIGGGQVLLIENLECFLKSEWIVPTTALVMYSAGRISDRLINCLARSDLGNLPLLHLTDYDPVGLSDYLRLRSAMGSRVALFVPHDLKHRFRDFGNEELIKAKPRNRVLLEKLNQTVWPCTASALVFELVKEYGAGLEQESLLLGLDGTEVSGA